MYELTFQIGYLLIGAALMLALMGIGTAVLMPGIDRWSRLFFISFFAILVLYASFVICEILCIRPGGRKTLEIIYYFETLLASSPH